MTTHYETLGVAPDASPEDIKRAYRAKRKAAHPDREGGSNDAMAAINRANDVLSDPKRRAQYDATGEDGDGPSVQDQAASLLAHHFAEALDAPGNMVVMTRRAIEELRASGLQNQGRLKQQVKKLTARRARIRVKSGPNIVHALIDAQLGALNAGIAKVDKLLPVVDEALRMLDAYESDEEVGLTRHGLDSMLMEAIRSTSFGTGSTRIFRGI
jgi:curved DNA-binding protein CbpA